MVDDRFFNKMKVANIPRVYYGKGIKYDGYIDDEMNIFTDNLLITGKGQKDRIILLTSILKDIIRKRPGAAFYRFENMVEHFRENKYLDLMKTFRGKRYIAIDNMDFNYMGGDWISSNVFKRFCGFLREVYESSDKISLLITTPHKDSLLESNLPKFLYEILESDFEVINM